MDQIINEIKDYLYTNNPSIEPNSIENLRKLLKYTFTNFRVHYHFKERILWPILGSSFRFSEDNLNELILKKIEELYIFNDILLYTALLDSIRNLLNYTESKKKEEYLHKINTHLKTIFQELKVQ